MLKDSIAWALGILKQCFSSWFVGFYSEGSMFHSAGFGVENGFEVFLTTSNGCTSDGRFIHPQG